VLSSVIAWAGGRFYILISGIVKLIGTKEMYSVSVSVQLEVFRSGIKEYRLQNQEMERK
jgi:hypothetical protein